MKLKEFIESKVSEAISSGKTNSRMLETPDIDKAESIISWLEELGFEKVDNSGYAISSRRAAERVARQSKSGKFYIIGLFTSYGTRWIEFGNVDVLFSIRTEQTRYARFEMFRTSEENRIPFDTEEEFFDAVRKELKI